MMMITDPNLAALRDALATLPQFAGRLQQPADQAQPMQAQGFRIPAWGAAGPPLNLPTGAYSQMPDINQGILQGAQGLADALAKWRG